MGSCYVCHFNPLIGPLMPIAYLIGASIYTLVILAQIPYISMFFAILSTTCAAIYIIGIVTLKFANPMLLSTYLKRSKDLYYSRNTSYNLFTMLLNLITIIAISLIFPIGALILTIATLLLYTFLSDSSV